MSKPMITKPCERCGKDFESEAWRETNSRYRRKVCSRKCARSVFPPPMERFWRYVRKTGPDECWEWFGPKGNCGYGQIYYNGRRHYCPKWAYEQFVGSVPEGLVLRHTCDNAACVNTNHLILGTLKDNSRDMLSRSRNPKVKLNPEKVRAIRQHFEKAPKNWAEYDAVAKQYGVTSCVIYGIVIGRNWAWVA